MRLLIRIGRYRRTVAAGICSIVLCGAALATAPSGGASPAAAAGGFANGTAKATAVVTKIAPGVGSFELASGTGIAVSEVKNSLAQAQAQALDLGIVGTTLTAEGCDGGEASVTPDQFPQPLRTDNREGDSTAREDEFPAAGATFGAGRMEVQATKQPLARATATSSKAVFGPVATVNGGQAQATTEIVGGKARQAHATVQASVDIAGIVQLRGMRWDALHRTGANRDAKATFEVAGIAAAGVPLPIEDLGAAEDAINQILAPSGITVLLPRIERFKQPADLVRVTPLGIVLKDSPAGKTAIGPVLDLTREQRVEMFNQLAAAYCDLAGALLVADIGVSIASGTGFLKIEIGGAEATTGELVLTDPFGAGTPGVGSGVLPSSGVALPGSAPIPGSGPVAGSPTSAPQQTVADVGPLETLCESVHPFRWPSCSKGAALPLGLIGLAATAGVAALDWRHQRRRAAARGLADPATVAVSA